MADAPPNEHSIRWTGDNIDAIFAFMAPGQPIHVNDLSHLRFSNAEQLVGVDTPDGVQVAAIGDWICRTGDTLTVQHAEESHR